MITWWIDSTYIMYQTKTKQNQTEMDWGSHCDDDDGIGSGIACCMVGSMLFLTLCFFFKFEFDFRFRFGLHFQLHRNVVKKKLFTIHRNIHDRNLHEIVHRHFVFSILWIQFLWHRILYVRSKRCHYNNSSANTHPYIYLYSVFRNNCHRLKEHVNSIAT